ncbi:MAG: YkgJ family cysteine cluster protein [Bdellovibrio sp.]
MTPQLKSILKQYKDILSCQELISLENEVDRLLKHYLGILAELPAGVERGQKVYALIEEQEQLSSHIKTSCQRGCGACCHLEVEITLDDAMVLAKSLESGIEIDYSQLRSLSLRDRLDSRWAQGVVGSNRCVFLGTDNACRNYENRPTVCRKHSVISPAIECEKIGGQPRPKLIPMAEIIMSAAINLPGNQYGSLSKMLQRVLDEQKPRILAQLDIE